MFATIKRLIDKETRLGAKAAQLAPDANLYESGLSSFDAARLLVAIEREFKVTFPRETLNRRAMTSIEAIALSVLSLWQLEMEPPKKLRKAA